MIWLMAALLPVLLMSAAFWYEEDSAARSIATRGLAPPEKHLLSVPVEWCDDGFYALMSWELNPWKNHSSYSQFEWRFLNRMGDSGKPEHREKYKKLRQQAEQWYQRLLARFPELGITYKNLPEKKNGLLQWYLFEKQLAEARRKDGMSDGFETVFDQSFRSSQLSPWDPAVAKQLLDQYRSDLEEARVIALMPERSSAVDSTGEFGRDPYFSWDFAVAFLLEARLFAGQGDAARALGSIRAATGISHHLADGEAPTLCEISLGAGIQRLIEGYVFSNILPSLPGGEVDVSLWEKVMSPEIRQPDDFSRLVRGEWQSGMRMNLLPYLADPSNPSIPTDSLALAEAYTTFSKSLATGNENLTLADLPSNPIVRPDYSDLSRRSRRIAGGLGMTPDSFNVRDAWERHQVHAGMTRAAFAILKGGPVPNDPVRDLPYRWDPVTRRLSLPDIPEYNEVPAELFLPEL